MWLTRRLSATTIHKTPNAINETLTISSDKFDVTKLNAVMKNAVV